MEKIKFSAQIKQFNRKALMSGDTQIRIILDVVDEQKKQSELMKNLSNIEFGQKIVFVEITKINNGEVDL